MSELPHQPNAQDKPSLDAGGAFQPIEEPARRAPPSPVMQGARWGMIAGYVIGTIYIRSNSPLGFYTGNLVLVYLVCIGICSGLGAALMWFDANTRERA